MEVIKTKYFVTVGSRWIIEVGDYSMVNKVYLCLDTDGGYILSVKTCLCSTFDFGDFDG